MGRFGSRAPHPYDTPKSCPAAYLRATPHLFSPPPPLCPLHQNFLGILDLHGTVRKPLALFNSFISDEESDAYSREGFAQCRLAGQQQSLECWERAPSVYLHTPECPVFLSQPPSSDFSHCIMPVVLSVYFLHLSLTPHSLLHFLNFNSYCLSRGRL